MELRLNTARHRHLCWAVTKTARQDLEARYDFPAMSRVLAGQAVGILQVPLQY